MLHHLLRALFITTIAFAAPLLAPAQVNQMDTTDDTAPSSTAPAPKTPDAAAPSVAPSAAPSATPAAPPSAETAAPASTNLEIRAGVISDSHDQTFRGKISTTPGKLLRLFVEKKPRSFPISQVKEIIFTPKREEMTRKFVFKEFGNDEKIFNGQPYPERQIETTVEFTNGEKITGRLDACVFYIQPDNSPDAMKFVFQYIQQGKEGETLKSLLYLTKITFTSPGAPVGSNIGNIRLLTTPLPGPKALIGALSRKTLFPMELKLTREPGVFTTDGMIAEGVYFAFSENRKAYVSWPAPKPNMTEKEKAKEKELFDAANKLILSVENFFDERKLLAARISDNGFEVHALVSLHRAKEQQWADQPWQLAVWRYKFDSDFKQMYFDYEKCILRVNKIATKDLPEIILSPELWQAEYKGKELVLGKKNP